MIVLVSKIIKISEIIAESGGNSKIGALLRNVQVRFGGCQIYWDLKGRTDVTDIIRLKEGSSIACCSQLKPILNLIGDGRIILESHTALSGISIEKNVQPVRDKPTAASFAMKVEGNKVRLSNLDINGSCNYGILVVDSQGIKFKYCKLDGFKIACLTIRDSSFMIDNVVSSNSRHGIHLLGSHGLVKHCSSLRNRRHGFTIVHCPEPIVVKSCISMENIGNGFVFGGSKRSLASNKGWRITGCVARNNSGNGFSIDPTLAGKDDAITQNGGIENCVSLENLQHGFYITHARNVSVTNCTANRNNNAGIAVSKSRDITVNMSTTIGNFKTEIAFYGGHVEGTGGYIVKKHKNMLKEDDVSYKILPPFGIFIRD